MKICFFSLLFTNFRYNNLIHSSNDQLAVSIFKNQCEVIHLNIFIMVWSVVLSLATCKSFAIWNSLKWSLRSYGMILLPYFLVAKMFLTHSDISFSRVESGLFSMESGSFLLVIGIISTTFWMLRMLISPRFTLCRLGGGGAWINFLNSLFYSYISNSEL